MHRRAAKFHLMLTSIDKFKVHPRPFYIRDASLSYLFLNCDHCSNHKMKLSSIIGFTTLAHGASAHCTTLKTGNRYLTDILKRYVDHPHCRQHNDHVGCSPARQQYARTECHIDSDDLQHQHQYRFPNGLRDSRNYRRIQARQHTIPSRTCRDIHRQSTWLRCWLGWGRRFVAQGALILKVACGD